MTGTGFRCSAMGAASRWGTTPRAATLLSGRVCDAVAEVRPAACWSGVDLRAVRRGVRCALPDVPGAAAASWRVACLGDGAGSPYGCGLTPRLDPAGQETGTARPPPR